MFRETLNVRASDRVEGRRVYTEILGLKLTNRFGNHWATVKVGDTLVIGLHPWSAKYPRATITPTDPSMSAS